MSTTIERTTLREPLATADVRGKLEHKTISELNAEAARLRDSIAKRETLGVPAILGQPERLAEVNAQLVELEARQAGIRGEVRRIHAEAKDHCEALVVLGRDAESLIARNHAELRGEPRLTETYSEFGTLNYASVIAASAVTKLTRALEYIQA